MDAREAQKSIQEIRDIMTRTTQFAHVSGGAWILTGILAGFGALLSHWAWEVIPATTGPREYFTLKRIFVLIWGTVFSLSVTVNLLAMRRRARASGDPNFGRQLRQIITGFGPAVVVGAILTYVMLRRTPDFYPLIAPLWMFIYGMGLMSISLFTIRETRLLGMSFIACGAFSLFVWYDVPMPMLAFSFGGLHLVFGTWLLLKERMGMTDGAHP